MNLPEPGQAPSQPSVLVPRDALRTALRAWWVVVLTMILGGLAGLGAHSLLPVVYESHFDIQVNADLTNTGEMSQYEEDVAYEIVAGIFYLAPMPTRIAEALSQAGTATDPVQVYDAMTYERRVGTWRFRMRASTPQRAEELARTWLKLGGADLEAARSHALVADALLRKQLSLEACLAQSAASLPSQGECGPGDAKTLQTQLAESSKLLSDERTASRGLSSGILISPLPGAVSPAQAVLNQRGLTVGAGALAGLVLGLWLAQSGLAERLLRGRRG